MGVGLAHHHAAERAADIDLAQNVFEAGNGIQAEGRGIVGQRTGHGRHGHRSRRGRRRRAAAAAASWAIAGAAKPSIPARLTVPKNNLVKFFIYQVLSLPDACAHRGCAPGLR